MTLCRWGRQGLPVYSLAALFVGIGLLLIADGAQGERVDLQWLDATGGQVQELQVRGDYAYLALGSGLVVVDVSNASAPEEVAAYPLQGRTHTLGLYNEWLYLANEDNLWVYNLSNPAEPQAQGLFNGELRAERIFFDEGYAYILEDNQEIVVLELLDPLHPEEISRMAPMTGITDMVVKEKLLYIAGRSEGLRIFDVGEPAKPALLGNLSLSGSIASLGVQGTKVYAVDIETGMRIIDVSDPTAPEEVGVLESLEAHDIQVKGTIAYLANGGMGLKVIDVTNPVNPVMIDQYNPPDLRAELLTIAGDGLFLTDRSRGFTILDLSLPSNPLELGFQPLFGSPGKLSKADRRAFVNWAEGLVSVDLTREGLAEGLILEELNPINGKVVAYEDYLTVIEYAQWEGQSLTRGGLRVFDPAKPAGQQEVFTSRFGATDGVLVGNRLYVTDNNSIGVWSLEDPVNPVLLDSYGFTGKVSLLAVEEERLYAISSQERLHILTIGEDSSLTGLADLSQTCSPTSIAVNSQMVYLIDPGRGVCVVNATDSSQPKPVGVWNAGGAEEIFLTGHLGFLAAGERGVYALEFSDNGMPLVAATYQTPGRAVSLGLSGVYLLVSDSVGGLQLLGWNLAPDVTEIALSPEQANEGQTLMVSGQGADLDGSVTQYQWRSDRHGQLGDSRNLILDDLRPGPLTIYLRVADEKGAWSEWEQRKLDVNARPVLAEGRASPDSGNETTLFSFSVRYHDPDKSPGATVLLNIEGLEALPMEREGQSELFRYQGRLTGGWRNYSFSAIDGLGAQAVILVPGRPFYVNLLPRSIIETPNGQSIEVGDTVSFLGSGMDTDGTIVAYQWSNLSGVVGNEANLTLEGLEVGEHEIGLRVQDSHGDWSAETTVIVIVEPTEEPTPLLEQPLVRAGGAAGAVAVGTLAFGFLVIGEPFRYKFFYLLAPLMARHRKERSGADPLANEIRGMIRGYLLAHPGVHYGYLKEELGLVNGTLAYHLQVLEREGLVASVKQGRKRLFYPVGKGVPGNGYKPLPETKPKPSGEKYARWTGKGWHHNPAGKGQTEPRKPKTINARPVTKTKLLALVEKQPGISQGELAESFGVSGAAIKYHVDQHIAQGKLKRERKGMKVAYYLEKKTGGSPPKSSS